MKTLSAIAKKRLNALADYLDRYASEIEQHFDMDAWFHHDGINEYGDEHGVEEGNSIKKKDINVCGTSACALGWACQVPALANIGIELVYTGEDYGAVCPIGKGYDDDRDIFKVAAKAFDISCPQARYLFLPLNSEGEDDRDGDGDTQKETPEHWAARCRLLIGVNGDVDNIALPR